MTLWTLQTFNLPGGRAASQVALKKLCYLFTGLDFCYTGIVQVKLHEKKTL